MSLTTRQGAVLVLVYVPIVAVRLLGLVSQFIAWSFEHVEQWTYTAERAIQRFARWLAGVPQRPRR